MIFEAEDAVAIDNATVQYESVVVYPPFNYLNWTLLIYTMHSSVIQLL